MSGLVFGEYIKRGVIASVEEVNAEEPIFTGIPIQLFKNGRHKVSMIYMCVCVYVCMYVCMYMYMIDYLNTTDALAFP